MESLFRSRSKVSASPQIQSVYVPLTSTSIPKSKVDESICNWLHEEFHYVLGYFDLPSAIKSQTALPECCDFLAEPDEEMWRVILEMQVPSSHVKILTDGGNQQLHVAIDKQRHLILIVNLYRLVVCLPDRSLPSSEYKKFSKEVFLNELSTSFPGFGFLP